MSSRTHSFDLGYAVLSDPEIEAIWRSPHQRDPELDAAILRQLVLRALPVIEGTLLSAGTRLDLRRGDLERACDEVAVRLYARLRRDRRVRNVRALAHQLTLEVVQDPLRRREPEVMCFVCSPPRLRLVERQEMR